MDTTVDKLVSRDYTVSTQQKFESNKIGVQRRTKLRNTGSELN